MQNKFLLIFVFLLALICSPVVFADEIIVTDADTIYNITQEPAVDIGISPGEPNVMVVKYADIIGYYLLENATNISRLVGEPGVMVVKYADGIACNSLENATYVQQLPGEPDVMVVKYADTITSFISSPHPIFLNGTFLLKVEGRPEVYWLQNDRLYQITDWDVINQMSGIPGWDNVNTYPANEFDPSEYPQSPRFINTGIESDNLLIRLWGDYKVYLIENGVKRHITYPDVIDLNGYVMEDVINVSQDIIEMFPDGDPIGIEVNLTFSKKTDSGEEPYVTEFITNDTIKFYTETIVSENYTVDTYVRLSEPNGRTRYAYYPNSDFLPTDQLLSSDTEVSLYPNQWNAVTKNWNWNEYTFDDDEEGIYTWEFYYKDVISGKVLGWDRKSYSFNEI